MNTKLKTKLELLIRVIDRITILAGKISGVMGIGLCLLVFSSVVLRYFFHRPISWSDELCAYIYIYHCIMALAYATYLESHVSAELLNDKFSPRLQFLISVVGYAAMMACIAVIVFYGCKTTYLYYLREWRSATEHEMLLWPVMVVIPAGFALFFLQCISRVYVSIVRIHARDSHALEAQH